MSWQERLRRMVDPGDYSWTGIKTYKEPSEASFQEKYLSLLEHHQTETASLIKLIRKLAALLLEAQTFTDREIR